MKSNLENSIKTSLENYELPYDAAAWSALNARLDAQMPTQTTKPKGKGGYIAAAIVVTAGITAALIYFYQPETSTKNGIAENEVLIGNETKKVESTSKTSANEVNSSVQNELDNTPSSQSFSERNKTSEKITSETSFSEIENASETRVNNTIATDNKTENKVNSAQDNTNNSTPSISWITPNITSVCQNEQFNISNNNSEIIYVQAPNGNTKRINPKSSIDYLAKEGGDYKILGLEKEGSKLISTFYVKPAEEVDFSIDQNTKFNQGLPTTPLSTNASGNNIEWTFSDSKVKLSGSTVNAHFYNSGSKTITLTVKGFNGCPSIARKTITIEEDYNLMAITGFYPLGVDSRTNRFMPLALEERNTPFNMIIIDPKDGGIVFETKSADIPWDGIDKRNGKLVENTTFIWKVTLQKPEPGERSEYTGMITRL